MGSSPLSSAVSEACWREGLSHKEHYRRFYEYWKDGNMDRERVEEVREKLAS
jgi:hypothetical protein